MFLSTNQLDLIERAYISPIDFLEADLRTVCALSARGLAEVIYARKSGDISRVLLTPAGRMIGLDIQRFRLLPSFREIMKDLTPHKKALKH